MLPCVSNGRPGPQAARAAPRTLFGLSPGGVCRAAAVTSRPVRSYRTFSPLPVRRSGLRRYVFCGTFPGVAPGGRYPPPCPVEPGLSSIRKRGQRPPARPGNIIPDAARAVMVKAHVCQKTAAAFLWRGRPGERKLVIYKGLESPERRNSGTFSAGAGSWIMG